MRHDFSVDRQQAKKTWQPRVNVFYKMLFLFKTLNEINCLHQHQLFDRVQ